MHGDEHSQFVESLRRQSGFEYVQISSEQMTHPEALHRLQLGADYLYSVYIRGRARRGRR